MKYAVILIIFFYFLALVQVSFMPHFGILGMTPNVVLLSVILINLFENPERKIGFAAAVFAGLFLDIFSSSFIGFYILISLAIAILLKYILRRYVKLPAFG